MQVSVLTLFPEMYSSLTQSGISGRAVNNGLISISTYNPRDFAEDKHRNVDDKPYGGGPGMVMTVGPLARTLSQVRQDMKMNMASGEPTSSSARPKVICLSPQGSQLNQAKVIALSRLPQLILVCGRYEGIDERFIEAEVDEEISIGDYVISGGELASMVVLDAIIRHLPGALGDETSAQQDSFSRTGLLDCPHYSRPEHWQGKDVPKVLRSGDHNEIRKWRLQQSLLRTRIRRPDLFAQLTLSDEEAELLRRLEVN